MMHFLLTEIKRPAMADLPPPSYDDAIAGEYTSAPEPSSNPPPPSFPHSSQSSALIPEPSAPPESNRDIIPVSSRQEGHSSERQQQETFLQSQANDNDNEQNLPSGSKRCKILKIAVFIFCILIGAGFLWSELSPKADEEDLSQKMPDKKFSCEKFFLPYFFGKATNDHRSIPQPLNCSRNSYGNYDTGTQCEFNCDGNMSLFGRNRTSDWIDLKSTSFTATCEGDSKWEVRVIQANYKEIVCGKYTTSGCENYNPTLQCLPPQNPHNCKSPPPKISKAKPYNDCMRNIYGTYLDGKKCYFKCERKNVLWSSEGVIKKPQIKCLNGRAPESALKSYGLPRCKAEQTNEGDFTCKKGKWKMEVNYRQIEIGETNTTIECKDPPPPPSCGNPPNMSKATWWNCQKHRRYREGERCNFMCDSGYVLSSSRVQDGSHYTEGTSTCSNSEWRMHGNDPKLKCVTLKEIVE